MFSPELLQRYLQNLHSAKQRFQGVTLHKKRSCSLATPKQTGYVTCLLTHASSFTDHDQPGHLQAAVGRMSALQRHAYQQGLCGDPDPQNHLWYGLLQVHFITLLLFTSLCIPLKKRQRSNSLVIYSHIKTSVC